MPYKFPPIFDVTALAEELIRRPDTKAAGYAVLQLLDAASAHADLLFARELLATMVLDAQGELDHPSPYSNAVRGALLAQTILLYARAVIVNNDRRRRFDIRPRLNAQQRKVHAEIDEMRDRAIAHFDRTVRRHEAKWADEKVIVPGDEPFRLIVALRRMVVRPELLQTLIDQVHAVLEILGEIREEKQTAATTAMFDLLDRQPEWGARLQKQNIDVLELIGNFEQIADMLGPGFGAGQIHNSRGDEEGTVHFPSSVD